MVNISDNLILTSLVLIYILGEEGCPEYHHHYLYEIIMPIPVCMLPWGQVRHWDRPSVLLYVPFGHLMG